MRFGWRQSSELASTFYFLDKEFVRGNHLIVDCPERWDTIVLNLIGTDYFNPALPNVYTWDHLSGQIAGDLVAYVDDLRGISCCIEHAWVISHRAASQLEYLGSQDAPRKRRVDNGFWVGGLFNDYSNQMDHGK